eukprot:scaffold66976_cov18-Tisochrysis_lutea.AAC.1
MKVVPRCNKAQLKAGIPTISKSKAKSLVKDNKHVLGQRVALCATRLKGKNQQHQNLKRGGLRWLTCPWTTARHSRTTKSMFGRPMCVDTMVKGMPLKRPANRRSELLPQIEHNVPGGLSEAQNQ